MKGEFTMTLKIPQRFTCNGHSNKQDYIFTIVFEFQSILTSPFLLQNKNY